MNNSCQCQITVKGGVNNAFQHTLLDFALCSLLNLKLIFLFTILALQQEVAETETAAELALHLPPCDVDADLPENVYKFDDCILHLVLARRVDDELRCNFKKYKESHHFSTLKLLALFCLYL